jgi:hypothetical protein
MSFDPRASIQFVLLALCLRTGACREPALDRYDAQCNVEAVAACALALSMSEGRGDPEAACVFACDHTRPDSAQHGRPAEGDK